MYLRDLQLDVPYKEQSEVIIEISNTNNCSYEEALRIDYDRNWKWNIKRRFTLETNCIVSMFLRLLGKYKTKECKKILVRCVDKVTQNNVINSSGIYIIEQKVDYTSFFSYDDKEKKPFTLNVIKNAIAKIAHEKEWDITPFEEVYKKIIDLNYNNYWTWGKKIKSPNKMYAAKVYLEHEVKDIKIYIIIQNKQGHIVRAQLILKESPHEYAYVKHLGKLTWLSNNEVQFINKNNTRQWSVCIEEMSVHKNV